MSLLIGADDFLDGCTTVDGKVMSVREIIRELLALRRRLDEFQTGEAQFDSEMGNDVLRKKNRELEEKVKNLEYCATMWESQKDLARVECHRLTEKVKKLEADIEERDAIIESQLCAGCAKRNVYYQGSVHPPVNSVEQLPEGNEGDTCWVGNPLIWPDGSICNNPGCMYKFHNGEWLELEI